MRSQGLTTMIPSTLTAMYICAYARSVEFEWDPVKANANFRKHGVLFSDAVSVLEDELALTVRDPHSEEEQRWITLASIYSATYSSWSMCGEAKQFDLFRRDRQRRANGRNTKVRAPRSAHQKEER